MSQENTEAVRAFYDLFLSGKIEELAASLAEDFVLVNPLPEPIPFGGRYEGTAGLLGYLGRIAETLEIEEFAVDEILGEDDRVVALGRERSRAKASGGRYEMEWVHVFRLSEGRIASMREYNDTAAMRAAFETQG